ncbi:MAG: HAD family hydrolase [Candidatus Methanodesulfokora sp.]
MKAAFVWDFDGVIAQTPHEDAWREACKLYGIRGFTHEFYQEFVSGRPRLEGGRNILKLLWLPGMKEGEMELEVRKFTDLKNEIYLEMVRKGSYAIREDVVRFIVESKRVGIIQILASASKNVLFIAEREHISSGIKLRDLFDLDLSGSGGSKEEIFRNALKAVESGNCCVVFFDDSPSGIQAAKSLGGLAVGCFNEKLRDYGADAVVTDFSRLSPVDLLRRVGC